MTERERLSQPACWDLFMGMFPHGLDDGAIVAELTRRGYRTLSPDEAADLLGRCLWDVFSNNHDVTTADGKAVDLGSFRAAAGFVAAFRSQRAAHDDGVHDRCDYLDFYMGTLGMRDEDLSPVYDVIFARMRSAGLAWRYVHPRIYLIDMGNWSDQREGFEEYDPSQSVARQLERQLRASETAELRAQLDRAYRESVGEARRNPPPAVVQSYQRMYGCYPDGWPPS